MKYFTFSLLALFVLVFTASFSMAAPVAPAASVGGGSSGGITTVPNTTPDPIVEASVLPEKKPKKKKVKKGESHTNGDGVTVTNDEDSSGTITIDPAEGNSKSKTTCKSTTGFEGTVSGIDGNDVVMLSSSNTVSVSGAGGSVSVGGGSTVSFINGLGGGNMNVQLPSGGSLVIGPGSKITVTT